MTKKYRIFDILVLTIVEDFLWQEIEIVEYNFTRVCREFLPLRMVFFAVFCS